MNTNFDLKRAMAYFSLKIKHSNKRAFDIERQQKRRILARLVCVQKALVDKPSKLPC